MKFRRFERLLTHLTGTWAILESRLNEIREEVQDGIRAGAESMEQRLADFEASIGADGKIKVPKPLIVGGVGILPIQGVISQKYDWIMEYIGGCSTEILTAQLEQLVSSSDVRAILLDIDSPGGSVSGVPELAAAVARAAEIKPVFASVNPMCASAAYWIASQATEIAVTPSGLAGSIGVISTHVDWSESLKKAGVAVTLIRSGKFKAEGSPYEPLSDEAKAHLQSICDELYGQFINAVAKGRKATPAAVREHYGQGRVLTARAAKDAGMVDRIETYADTLARALRRTGRGAPGAGARAFESIRDFETFLRDEGGLSNAEAKRIASRGYAPRDGAAPDEDPPQDPTDHSAELSDSLKAFTAAVNPVQEN